MTLNKGNALKKRQKMKKEFYKLSIVFTMIVFSFSLAFFLGREVTLSGLQKSQDSSIVKSRRKPSPAPQRVDEPQGAPLVRGQRGGQSPQKMQEYKKAPAQTWDQAQDQVQEPPHQQAEENAPTPPLAEEDSTPPATPPANRKAKSAEDLRLKSREPENAKTPLEQHSQKENKKITALLVSVHHDKESATEKSTQLKIRFPRWKIFFKESENLYKVYIGPFRTKASAEKFLNKLKNKPDLSGAKLEEI